MVGHGGPSPISFDSVSLPQHVRRRSESTGLLSASRSGAPTDGCSVGRVWIYWGYLGISLVFSNSNDQGAKVVHLPVWFVGVVNASSLACFMRQRLPKLN